MAATASSPAPSPVRLDAGKILWLLVLFCAVTLYPPGDVIATIQHLRVPDTDDAMRLVEARDLAGGQGWYDNVQYRFLPPSGVPSHWSRLLDAPLAVCDARTVEAGDLVASDIFYPERAGEIYQARYRPGHAWWYFSAMTRDEVLVFKQFDSAPQCASATPHVKSHANTSFFMTLSLEENR